MTQDERLGTLISWIDAMSVGVPEIDGDHQEWINILNDLADAITAKDRKAYFRVLARSVEYPTYHFEREEAFMEKIGYPDLEDHRRAHHHFTAKIVKHYKGMRDDYDPDSFFEKGIDYLILVSEWLQDHIMGTDQEIKDFLLKK